MNNFTEMKMNLNKIKTDINIRKFNDLIKLYDSYICNFYDDNILSKIHELFPNLYFNNESLEILETFDFIFNKIMSESIINEDYDYINYMSKYRHKIIFKKKYIRKSIENIKSLKLLLKLNLINDKEDILFVLYSLAKKNNFTDTHAKLISYIYMNFNINSNVKIKMYKLLSKKN